MERVMTVEEKIRRAEERYEKKMQGLEMPSTKIRSEQDKKNLKLLKKMIVQILICSTIATSIYIIQNSNSTFATSIIEKISLILSNDTNFGAIINESKNKTQEIFRNMPSMTVKNKEENKTTEENQTQNETPVEGIGGAEEENQSQVNEVEQKLSEQELEIEEIHKTTSFIKPVEGVITSKFGQRDTATGNVPKNHTGVDIAANTGTKIIAATDGEVVLASEEGDYGKHLKIQVGDVSVIYAHCNNLYVKHGDIVKQGQEVAEVGSTGNSTGPHLHFEIRYKEKMINPQNILEL